MLRFLFKEIQYAQTYLYNIPIYTRVINVYTQGVLGLQSLHMLYA